MIREWWLQPTPALELTVAGNGQSGKEVVDAGGQAGQWSQLSSLQSTPNSCYLFETGRSWDWGAVSWEPAGDVTALTPHSNSIYGYATATHRWQRFVSFIIFIFCGSESKGQIHRCTSDCRHLKRSSLRTAFPLVHMIPRRRQMSSVIFKTCFSTWREWGSL